MFLGIDIGTSEVKALLLGEIDSGKSPNGLSQSQVIEGAGKPLALSRPFPGHSEQHPDAWWKATQSALADLRAQQPAAYAAVEAIGLSGQMHGAVLLDAHQQVLRPAPLWNDTRASAECTAMMTEMPGLAQQAGSLAMPGFTAPKLRWLAQHEPAIFERIACVMLPKDYVRLQLTGEAVTDMSDASGTMWLDIACRDWSDKALELTGLTRQQMPRLVEGSAVSGLLSAKAAAMLHLKPGIVVAGGAGDNAASAVGMGAVDAGQGFVSLGTSGVIFLVTPQFQPNLASATHAFCHALPKRWHQMSVMLSAASCLPWAARLLGLPSVDALEALARSLSLTERAAAPIFLPYLGGERTPHNHADLRGSFHLLGHDTGPAAMAYAVLEGVAFGLKDGLQALQAAGSQAGDLSLVGGGARSVFWAQLLASCLNVQRITTHSASTAGAALGAARLAWLAAGGDIATVCKPPCIEAEYFPVTAEKAVLEGRHAQFKAFLQI